MSSKQLRSPAHSDDDVDGWATASDESSDDLPPMLMHHQQGMQRMSVAGDSQDHRRHRSGCRGIITCTLCCFALAFSAMLAVIIASSLGHGATMRHMTSRALRGVLEHVEGAERRAAGRLHGAIASGRELEPDLEALADLIVAEEAADRGLEVVSADLAASRDGASAAKLIAMGDTLKSAKLMAEGDVKAMVYRIEEDVEAASRSSSSGGGKKVPLKLMQQVASAGDALASLDNEADVFATVASSVAAKAAAPGATSAEKALADKDLRAVAESIEAVVVAKQKTVKRLVAAAKRAGN